MRLRPGAAKYPDPALGRCSSQHRASPRVPDGADSRFEIVGESPPTTFPQIDQLCQPYRDGGKTETPLLGWAGSPLKG